MAKAARKLTDDEGTFLALLNRIEPTSAYQISKIYSDSPVSTFGTSKGKIYPMIRRLIGHGLVKATKDKSDSRGTEHLTCTAQGREAVRQWVKEMKASHFLLNDPLRTKVQSFDLLTHDEQIEWIADAKAGLQSKLQELESYALVVDVPFKDTVHDNAVSSVRFRLDWLDRLLVDVVRGSRQKRIPG